MATVNLGSVRGPEGLKGIDGESIPGPPGPRGVQGEPGAVFIPIVHDNGDLSWDIESEYDYLADENGNPITFGGELIALGKRPMLPLPKTVNLTGDRGDRGVIGQRGLPFANDLYKKVCEKGYTGTEEQFYNAIVNHEKKKNKVIEISEDSTDIEYPSALAVWKLRRDILTEDYEISVKVNPVGSGIVSGAGFYKKDVEVTLSQTEDYRYRFNGWYSSSGVLLGKEDTLTFTPKRSTTIVAKYIAKPVYLITTSIEPENSGVVTGDGEYVEDQTANLSAISNEGYAFVNYKENDDVVYSNANYSFNVDRDRHILATFKESRLPPGYTELEYVSGSSTAYLNTGVYPKSLNTIVADIYNTGSGWYIQSYNTGSGLSNEYYIVSVGTVTSGAVTGIVIYTWSGSNTTSTKAITSITYGRKTITLNFSNKTASVDNKSTSFAYSSISSLGTLCVPGKNGGGSCRIYSCKIYSGSTLVKDFIPCKNSSGTVGFYDLVNKNFYKSDGTSSFGAGTVI